MVTKVAAHAPRGHLDTRFYQLLRSRQAAIAALIERRPFLVMFATGAVSVLSMAPFHAWPVLFFTLPVLFWALDSRPPLAGSANEYPAAKTHAMSWRSAAWRGWAFGFGYHLAGLYWIGFSFLVQAERFAALMPFAILSLTASLGLFFSCAAVGFALARDRLPPGLPRIVLLALTIMVAEWLRGHILTGFPWNVLGYALTMPLPMMQWVGLLGIYGLTAVAVITLASPLVILCAGHRHPGRMIGAVTFAPLIFAFAYGAWQLHMHPTRFNTDVRLRLVQPSFSQRDKFDETKRVSIFRRHLEMSQQGFGAGTLVDPQQLPTHVIWPEAAIPFFIRRNPQALQEIASALPDDVRIIAGTFRINVPPQVPNEDVGRYRVYNSAMVFAGNGQIESIYDKIHLVPFGEYLPAQKFLNALGFEDLTRTNGGLALGAAPRRLMNIAGLPPVSMLICYEASFPGEIVQGDERPGLLMNLTNDAWFGVTTGPYQHFHQTRVRAVEEGVPIIRSANTGISAIVDPVGRVLGKLPLNAIGSLDLTLPIAEKPPVYARYGLIVEVVMLALLSMFVLIAGARGGVVPGSGDGG